MGRRRSIALQVSTGAAAPFARRVPPSFQLEGRPPCRPKHQARSAVHEEHANQESAFAFRGRVPDKGGSRRKSGRRRSIALQVSTGAVAPFARRVPPSFQLEGRPPCRPKHQARSAVHEERASFRQGRLPPQKWDDTEVIPPAFERRCRADRALGDPLRSQWGDVVGVKAGRRCGGGAARYGSGAAVLPCPEDRFRRFHDRSPRFA